MDGNLSDSFCCHYQSFPSIWRQNKKIFRWSNKKARVSCNLPIQKNFEKQRENPKKFGKGKVRGASQVLLVNLDNGTTVTEIDMTMRRPQKSEHSDAAEAPGQEHKNDIGRTAQHPYK